MRLAVAIGGAALWAILPLISHASAFLSLLPLGAGLAWWGLGSLERRFYEGRAVPLRNLLEKK
jgi:hypothetical protein